MANNEKIVRPKTTKMAGIEMIFTPFIFSWFMFLMLLFFTLMIHITAREKGEEWTRDCPHHTPPSHKHIDAHVILLNLMRIRFILGLKLVESGEIKKGYWWTRNRLKMLLAWKKKKEKGKKGFHFACFLKENGVVFWWKFLFDAYGEQLKETSLNDFWDENDEIVVKFQEKREVVLRNKKIELEKYQTLTVEI